MTREPDPAPHTTKETQPVNADAPTNDSGGTVKPGGLGEQGTIPANPDGVAAGHSDSASHFNAEEDEAAH